MKVTKSLVYADACSAQPDEYTEYDNYMIKFGSQVDYEITDKVGRGKYADVYSGVKMTTGDEVAVKIFKPVKKDKIRREVKILNELKGHESIIEIQDVVRDVSTKIPAIITEYVDQGEIEVRKQWMNMSLEQVQFYMRSVLEALDFAHSKGIMHRDIKPHNIFIDNARRSVKLGDWGLAEYYKPGQEYSTRVAAQFYKAPELLLGYPYYDYSVDIWALGCVLAELVFHKQPFFAGKKPIDQLVKIVKVLGTKRLNEYVEEYNIEMDSSIKDILGKHTEKAWDTFKTNKNEHLYSEEVVDLITQMLQYDHTKRITAKEALNHPFLQTI